MAAGMHENIHLARMTARDVPEVHALEVRCFTAPWDIASYYNEVLNPSSYYLVAREDEMLVGFGGMWIIGDEAHIVTLATHSAKRRRGIARRIMCGLLEEATRQEVEYITLEVRVSNTPAQRLYASFGFNTIATRPRYYPDNGEDALVMLLKVAQWQPDGQG